MYDVVYPARQHQTNEVHRSQETPTFCPSCLSPAPSPRHRSFCLSQSVAERHGTGASADWFLRVFLWPERSLLFITE